MKSNIVINTKAKGALAESIRTLRTNLQFTLANSKDKIVMITSSVPDEGKSFVSSNLAAAFAMTKSKVLLIDCDLRKGVQERIFGLDNSKGLSNLLIDDVQNFKDYIVKSDVENLSILPRGIVPPNPSELLNGDKCKELFKKLKTAYDLIIVDSPPVNAVADSLVLLPVVDQVIIVAEYKFTPMDLLEKTKKSLEAGGAKITGVVVNGMSTKQIGKYYHYSRYY